MLDNIDINLLLKNIHSGEINPDSIPCIDLYMDQVISLFETTMSEKSNISDDKVITKTMINNYSKDNLIFPVKNKKYSRSHIIMLIMIYTLKQGLTMQGIKSLLSPVLNMNEDGNRDISSELDDLYRIFLELSEKETAEAVEKFNKRINDIKLAIPDNSNGKDDKQLIMMIILLINNANIQRKFAENLINEYFKKPVSEKDKK